MLVATAVSLIPSGGVTRTQKIRSPLMGIQNYIYLSSSSVLLYVRGKEQEKKNQQTNKKPKTTCNSHANNLPSTEQATTAQPKKKKKKVSHFSSFLTVYLLFKCRFVAWQRGFPQNLHIVCPCHNKSAFFWTFLCLDLLRPASCTFWAFWPSACGARDAGVVNWDRG